MRAIRHSRSAVVSLAALLVVTGCGGATQGESSGPSDAASAPPTASPALTLPPASPTPSAGPTTEPTPEATEVPATEAPASPEPTTGSGSAAACTGSDANRDFYASAAAALDWAVYCAVLPSGWFVNTGEYTLREGGRLTIEYKGPGGATFALDERGSCELADGCAPAGTGIGPASFGDRSGTLVAISDGRFVVYAGDASGFWQATGMGLHEELFTELAADLAEVSG